MYIVTRAYSLTFLIPCTHTEQLWCEMISMFEESLSKLVSAPFQLPIHLSPRTPVGSFKHAILLHLPSSSTKFRFVAVESGLSS